MHFARYNPNLYNDEKNPIPDGCNGHDVGGGDAVKAQTLEPEFEGEVVGVFPDGSSKKLEKHNVRMRTGAGVYIAGFAASKSKTKVLVEGGSASVRFDAAQPIALIVRAKDNKANVVMCSAMGQEAMVMEAVQAGIKDFIVKPFKDDRLMKTVNSILGNP